MDRRRWLLGLVAVPLLFLAGCASSPRSGGIDVSLVNMSPGASTAFESTMVFTIRYQNSMPDPVTIQGSTHKVFLEDNFIGEALSHDPVEVSQLGTATQDVVAHIQNLTLARTLMVLAKQKTLTPREIALIKALGYTIEVTQTAPKTL